MEKSDTFEILLDTKGEIRYMRLELRGETWARVQRRVTSVWAGNASGSRKLAWGLEG